VVAASSGVARLGSRAPRREGDRRAVAWTALAGGLVIAVVGSLGDSPVVIGLGGGIVAALGAVLAPQLLLALFLVAGGLKTAPFLSGVPVDLTLLTAAGVLVAVGLRASRPDGLHPFPPASVLAIALAALIALSVLWAPDPALALDKAYRFEIFTLLAFYAPLVLVRSRSDLTRLMIFLVATSLLIALTAVPGKYPNQPLTIAGGKSEIELALYAGAGVVAAVGYLMLVSKSRWRVLWVIPAVVMANTVIEAGSRGALIGSMVTLVVIGVMVVARSRTRYVPVAFGVAAVVAAVVVGSQLTGPAAAKYQGLFGGEAPVQTLGKRNFLMRSGIEIARDYPMGRGAAGYEADTGFAYPHNALVEVAAEQGIIGLGLLLALIVAAFRSALRAREGPLSPEAIVVIGLLIILVADAMVSQTFTQFRLLWFAFGLAFAVTWIGRDDPDDPKLEPASVRGG
jgi:O-antigen ligase